jgi:UDP-N-acetylmuramoyl-L-alanyl-D-glutamate--2,6-diaminopimelate ligase
VLGLGRAGLAAAAALGRLAGSSAVHAWDDSERSRARARALGVQVGATGSGPPPLTGVCTVIKSPGIPPGHRLLEEARRRRLVVIDELELGWRLSTAPMLAVTGTNGKTTTCSLIADVLGAHGLGTALVGNAESGRGIALSALPSDHDGWLVAEVSSYQASGLDRLLADAAVLTNLSPDHLHWHGSMEAYGAAKRRVFIDGERAVGLGVINADDPFGRALSAEIRERGSRTLTYGCAADADYRIVATRPGIDEGELVLETPSGTVVAGVHLAGAHNGANLAAALALADGLGLARQTTLAAIATAKPPPGRMERIDAGQPFDVVVDFAHSPDSLTVVLANLRAVAGHRGGRLIALAPAGERETRRACGEIARRGCDHLILSAYSLHGEPRLLALASVLAGAREASGATLDVVIDRRTAIAGALEMAQAGDVVAILGRGATSRMVIDRHSPAIEFDDRAVTRELLS